MKKNIEKRKLQLANAQNSYRATQRSSGNERLQYWVNSEIKQKLNDLSKILGKSKQESIEYAIDVAYKSNLHK